MKLNHFPKGHSGTRFNPRDSDPKPIPLNQYSGDFALRVQGRKKKSEKLAKERVLQNCT